MIQDPNVVHRDLAWSRPEMRTLFNSHVVSRLWPGQEVTDLKREYTAYKPGKECLVLYTLWFGDPGTTSSRLASATFGPPSRLERIYERNYKEQAEGGACGLPASAVFLPDYPCLVEIFPTDWKLPSLRRAADPREAAALLSAGASAAGRADPPAVRAVEVLRYRPRRRCVLRYELEEPAIGGRNELIAKVYPKGPKAEWVRDKLGALRAQVTNGLRLPAPVPSAEASTLLVMERVPGANMGDMLESTETETEAKDVLRVAAGALVTFHGLALKTDEQRTIAGELEQLRRRTEQLCYAAPGLAEEVKVLLDRIAPMVEDVSGAEQCLIHGDYKPTQLLSEHDSAALVDLDRACIGDPAIDVGNFMAVLDKAALIEGVGHASGLADWFLAEYLELSGRRVLEERARLFEAIALVRMLVRKFERVPHKYFRYGRDWQPFALLDEADDRLQALGAR
jgi:tRNA A-37 threonylcarbamoyl transferase component Bud32